MKFVLAASGTVSACREVLNQAIASLEAPHKQEHAVVRAIAHYIVEENLDPLYVPWVDECTAMQSINRAVPPEPTTSFSIECTVDVVEVARSE